MTLYVTGWKACSDGCCVVVEDTELPPPRASVTVTRPMYQVLEDHPCIVDSGDDCDWDAE